jgi:predicted DNA-binding transcriptional regulator YafY
LVKEKHLHTGPGDRQGITIHFNIIDTRMHQQKAKQPLETPKLHRCIELAHLFHSGFRIKVKELATKFSVCKRTIFRDIRTLENAGVPIQYNKKKGGHVIQSGFRLRISSLEDEDLSLLIAAICTSEMMCQPLTRGRLQSVMARLLNQCPAYLQDHLSNIANSCRQESLEKKTVIINPELFVNILHALGQRKKIRLRVSNLSETNSTIQIKVAPYYFVIAPDTWYLFGHSTWHRRALAFDLQDIERADITEESYEIPSVFIG